MISKIFVFLVSIIFISTAAFAGHLHPEKCYQNIWCDEQKVKSEVVLTDKTRCDCISEVNAVEFDFGKKWAEAIGYSLCYSLQSRKRAGVVLILEEPEDYKSFFPLKLAIKHFNLQINAWEM